MPSATAAAAAEGLPEFNLATCPADPLIELIQRYREQLARFSANVKGSDEEWDALASVTYMPPWDELCNSAPAPTTYAGVLAGLEFLDEELKHQTYSDALAAVLRRCVAFLREGPQA